MTSPAGTGTEGALPDGVSRPTSRIVTVRRPGWIRAGGVAIAVGVLLLVVGAVTLSGQRVVQLAAARGRARVGNPIAFTAAAADYRITFVPDPLAAAEDIDRTANLGCEVTDPDGSTRALDTRRAAVRSAGRTGVNLADFRAVAGPTSVRCAWERSDRQGSYVVARSSKKVQLVGVVALAGGIVLVIGAGLVLAVGFRGKPERQPIPT